VCYMPSSSSSLRYDPIIASLVGGTGMTSRTLSIGDCVDGISLRPDLHYQVVPDPSVILLDRFGGSCVEGRMDNPITEPPFIKLQFTLCCNTTLDECGN
jgi:hypothetical protein